MSSSSACARETSGSQEMGRSLSTRRPTVTRSRFGGEHEDVLALLGVLPVDEGKPAAFGREQLLELDRHALLVGDVRLRLTHGRYLSV